MSAAPEPDEGTDVLWYEAGDGSLFTTWRGRDYRAIPMSAWGLPMEHAVEERTIDGVRCRRAAGKDTLEYDGLILELCLEGEKLSPCLALPLLAEALYRGSLESVGAGRAELLCPGGERVTLFRGEDGLPAAAELRRSERTELIVRITRWSAEE